MPSPASSVGPSSAHLSEGELWSLRENVHVQLEDAHIALVSRWGTLRIPQPTPVLREALRRMELGPARLENVPGTDDLLQRVQLLADLRQLGGLVVRSVGAGDGSGSLLSVVATRPESLLVPAAVPQDRPLRLSRFAALRPQDRGWILESPLSSFRVVFSRPEASSLIAALGRPVTAAQAARPLPVSARSAHTMLSYLMATGMVQASEDGEGEPRFPEDCDPVLRAWSPHDLMFHWSSRPGLGDGVFGATYPLRGAQPRPPALKELPAGPRVDLPRPHEEARTGPDMSLTDALEQRASVRAHGTRPLTLAQLGELLHRALRVRTGRAPAPGRDARPSSDRPYPSGGACYELEFYLSVSRCTGLAPGAYYYAPAEHCLVRLPDREAALGRILAEAGAGAGLSDAPDVLLTMTARFARVSWKYSGLAYALTLKNVGVVQQTLYLLTTAMGLAGCAIGTGDTGLSARVFGLDWREESAVGEFLLGSLPDRDGT
ncbi:SagB family peptide dehydrogenase [Streptomyces kanamyceticus]|uniref:SagB/ThcOx family dehydrogenase n=1 Tax=Streptomyces kanamyceticus TaxID=1967 RepID=UPI0037DD551B